MQWDPSRKAALFLVAILLLIVSGFLIWQFLHRGHGHEETIKFRMGGGVMTLTLPDGTSQSSATGSVQPLREALHLVAIADDVITHTFPDGRSENVAFHTLNSVAMETNDLGPLETDAFWILAGSDSKGAPVECRIPAGATGEAAMLHLLQSLPSFGNAKLMDAMSSHMRQTTIVWKRQL